VIFEVREKLWWIFERTNPSGQITIRPDISFFIIFCIPWLSFLKENVIFTFKLCYSYSYLQICLKSLRHIFFSIFVSHILKRECYILKLLLNFNKTKVEALPLKKLFQIIFLHSFVYLNFLVICMSKHSFLIQINNNSLCFNQV
jgi:hypothetical protein